MAKKIADSTLMQVSRELFSATSRCACQVELCITNEKTIPLMHTGNQHTRLPFSLSVTRELGILSALERFRNVQNVNESSWTGMSWTDTADSMRTGDIYE